MRCKTIVWLENKKAEFHNLIPSHVTREFHFIYFSQNDKYKQ